MTAFDPSARQVFSDNDFHGSESDGTIEVIDPATEERVGAVADCDPEEAATVAERAAEAQADWAALDPTTRAGFLHDVADSIDSSDFEAAAKLMSREHGKRF